MPRPVTPGLDGFLIEEIPDHPADIVARAVARFHVSRATVARHLRDLQARGVVVGNGRTRGRSYSLVVLLRREFWYEVEGLQEDLVWSQDVAPLLADLPANVRAICAYGLTEMVNNVREHSGAKRTHIGVTRTARDVEMRVYDSGVGVFAKITKAFHLASEHEAVIELSKGKLTTDEPSHSGEGIFFTSRAFDEFSILANGLFWHVSHDRRDLLIEGRRNEESTLIRMEIKANSSRMISRVFAGFQSPEGGFTKTEIPVMLAQLTDEHLVSRSAAKRLLARLENFDDVYLDFAKVPSIGQAFADEIFRVFRRTHPDVTLHVMNARASVQRMINHVERSSSGGSPIS